MLHPISIIQITKRHYPNQRNNGRNHRKSLGRVRGGGTIQLSGSIRVVLVEPDSGAIIPACLVFLHGRAIYRMMPPSIIDTPSVFALHALQKGCKYRLGCNGLEGPRCDRDRVRTV